MKCQIPATKALPHPLALKPCSPNPDEGPRPTDPSVPREAFGLRRPVPLPHGTGRVRRRLRYWLGNSQVSPDRPFAPVGRRLVVKAAQQPFRRNEAGERSHCLKMLPLSYGPETAGSPPRLSAVWSGAAGVGCIHHFTRQFGLDRPNLLEAARGDSREVGQRVLTPPQASPQDESGGLRTARPTNRPSVGRRVRTAPFLEKHLGALGTARPTLAVIASVVAFHCILLQA